MQHSLCRNTLP